jgi:hypothetical protein
MQSKTDNTITPQATNEDKLCDQITQTEVNISQNRST